MLRHKNLQSAYHVRLNRAQ